MFLEPVIDITLLQVNLMIRNYLLRTVYGRRYLLSITILRIRIYFLGLDWLDKIDYLHRSQFRGLLRDP